MENSEKKVCPFCNAEIDKNAKKCKYCGEWVCQKEEDFPEELKHFNWGAFLMNWIWGIMHKKYITLLYFPACLIPVLGPIAISVWFGFAGNKWAWQSKTWDSIEQFNECQQNWVRIWFILFIMGLIFALKTIITLVYIGSVEV